MRPIDADALKTKIKAAGTDGTIANYCRKVLAECLDNEAPTIDAIPVEWMKKLFEDDGDWNEEEALIDWVVRRWKQEQEADHGNV